MLTSSNLEWAFGVVGCFSGRRRIDFFLKAFLRSFNVGRHDEDRPSNSRSSAIFSISSNIYDTFKNSALKIKVCKGGVSENMAPEN